MSIQELEETVWEWAADQEIPYKTKTLDQLVGILGEVASVIREIVTFEQLWDAVAYQCDPEDSSKLDESRKKLRAAFGYVLVKWIVAAGMVNMSMEECLKEAYKNVRNTSSKASRSLWSRGTQ